jgi:hypothetical protein
MSNMSYCRFENTLNDLKDCFNHIDNVDNLSESEKRARERLIRICLDIANDYGDEV